MLWVDLPSAFAQISLNVYNDSLIQQATMQDSNLFVQIFLIRVL